MLIMATEGTSSCNVGRTRLYCYVLHYLSNMGQGFNSGSSVVLGLNSYPQILPQ